MLTATTLDELKKEYRRLGKLYHPDNGGSSEKMRLLNKEYQEAKKRLSRFPKTEIEFKSKSANVKTTCSVTHGCKWNEKVSIGDLISELKKYMAEHFPTVKYTIDHTTIRLGIELAFGTAKEIVADIKKALEEIISDYNYTECRVCGDSEYVSNWFESWGVTVEKDPDLKNQTWYQCGYTANWSQYY